MHNPIRIRKPHYAVAAIISIIILISMVALTTVAYAAPTSDRERSGLHSFIGDFFNKTFTVQISDGSTIFETKEQKDERESINEKIITEEATETYSLYDRFGSNINFIGYLGETRIETGIFDRFYTKIVDNDGEFKLSINDIKMFFQEPAVSNNVIYPTRPNVLSNEEVRSGYIDPRIQAYSAINKTGGETAIGNLYLSISKIYTSFVAFFADNSMYNILDGLYTDLMSDDFSSFLSDLIKWLLPLFLAISLIALTVGAFKTIKGQLALKTLLLSLINGIISLALVYTFIAKPNITSSFFGAFVNGVNSILDETLAEENDEVIGNRTENALEATLWRISVFEPWCKGMFGRSYNQLYTQFDDEVGHIKMYQSHDDVDVEWSDGESRWNSKDITGDIVIPLGAGAECRNWAALAYSCQSLYHIDATEDDAESGLHNQLLNTWPKAAVCPGNTQIYVDNFRWLDAKLNISPEYRTNNNTRMNFSKSNQYSESFVLWGLESVILAALLTPILIISIRRFVCLILIVSTGIRWMVVSALSLAMPGRYNVLDNLKKMLKPLYHYLWWSVMIFAAIVLYKALAGKSLVVNLVWLLAGIYLVRFKPITSTARIRNVVNKAKIAGLRLKNKVSGIFKKKT